MSLKDEIIAYKNNTDLRDRYVAYISDTSVPLENRWELFCEAPHDFKNHNYWIVNFSAQATIPECNINWDDFYFERHETIEMDNFVDEELLDCLECLIEDGELTEDGMASIVTAFKEEILQKNLGSFVFDW